MKSNWFKNNWLILVTGLVIGIAALVLGAHGNPGNMGFCIACFLRDTAGALGLHGAEVVQYFRPEIVGILLGSLIAAVAAKEFKGRGGSSPMIRFLLGVFVMIGALMFLGCPLRMVIRIGGGDWNALVGLVGFIVGILVGVVFLKKGFTLGRSYKQTLAEGAAFPVVYVLLFVLRRSSSSPKKVPAACMPRGVSRSSRVSSSARSASAAVCAWSAASATPSCSKTSALSPAS